MAMQEEETTSTRRLRVRPTKLMGLLLEKDEEDLSMRKPEVALEDLYLQKIRKDPVITALETIFEDPRPGKRVQQRQASPDAALLMGNRKLKRYFVFPSHYQPARSKLKQRKERALKFQRITGARGPSGNMFSDEDVIAALSCLRQMEADTLSLYQEEERQVLNLPNNSTPDLVEGMISSLSSLQVESESSLVPPNQVHEEAAPAQPQLSKEKRQRHRCEVISKGNVSPSTSPASTTTLHSSPKSSSSKITAREKRLKRRSGLLLPQNSSCPSSLPSDPKTPASTHSPKSHPRKPGRPKKMRENIPPEVKEDTTSSKAEAMQLKLGSKRSPDGALATPTKKQRTRKNNQETTKDPTSLLQRGIGRGKDKKQKDSKVKQSLTNRSLSDTTVPTSRIPQLPSSPPPPLPTLTKKGLSPILPKSAVACCGIANGGDGERRKRGEREAGGGTLPSSPSARLTALSLTVSTKQLSPRSKPRKIRRSARLSIGADVIEGLRKMENGGSDVSLGTVWAALSPIEQKVVKMGGDSRGEDSVPPPSSTATAKKKGQSKGRRRSNLYSRLEIMDAIGESAITTTTDSTSNVPNFTFKPVSPSPVSQHFPTQVSNDLTAAQDSLTALHPSMKPTPLIEPTLSSPQPILPSMQQEDSANGPKFTSTPLIDDVMLPGSPQAMTEKAEAVGNLQRGEELGKVLNPITPHSGPGGFLSPHSPLCDANIATYNIFEGCPDLSFPSPTPMASSLPASALTPSPTPPVSAITQSPAPPAPAITPSHALSSSTVMLSQTPPVSAHTSSQVPPASSLPPTQLPPAAALNSSQVPPSFALTSSQVPPSFSLTPTKVPPASVLTSSQTPPVSAQISSAPPIFALTPSPAPPPSALTSPQTPHSSAVTPSQAWRVSALTPTQVSTAAALTSSHAPTASAFTSSNTPPVSALTSSQALPSSVLTSSPTHPTQTTPPKENSTSSEDDFDSPVFQGILSNQTFIHMGKVYYGPPPSFPLSSTAPL